MRSTQLLLTALVVFTSTVSAQDTLFLNNGRVIVGKVLKVNTDVVEFKKSGQTDGSLYTIKNLYLDSIRYADGTKDLRKDLVQNEDTGPVLVHVADSDDQLIPKKSNIVYNPPQVEARGGNGAGLLATLFILGAAINYAEKQKCQQSNSNGDYNKNKQHQSNTCCCTSYSRCSHHK